MISEQDVIDAVVFASQEQRWAKISSDPHLSIKTIGLAMQATNSKKSTRDAQPVKVV